MSIFSAPPKPNQSGSQTVTTTFTYDALHRLTGKSYNDGATATVRYGYDGVAPQNCTPPTLTITNPIGRRTAMCDAAGAQAWSYDQMGRTNKDRRTTNGFTAQFLYWYNLDGSLKAITYPNRAVGYVPDAAGRVQKVHLIGGSGYVFADNILYAPHGAWQQMTIANGQSARAAAFNNRLQPVELRSDRPGEQTPVMRLLYNFTDAQGRNNGNVLTQTDAVQGVAYNFAYDQLNRLGSASTDLTSGPLCWGYTFGYDIWGNKLTKAGMSSHASCTGTLLSVSVNNKNQINSGGYAYDAAGNMTTVAGVGGSLVYDAENRMTSGSGATYTYDGDGRRAMKTAGSVVTSYFRSALDTAALVEYENNEVRREYIYFGGQVLARITQPGGSVRLHLTDHLGTPRVVTFSNGAAQCRHDYEPFGVERIPCTADGESRKFTGHERDSESGLDYMMARYYGSNLGRFLSPDEFAGGPVDAFSANDPLPPGPLPYADITNPQSLNKYTYTYNNPLRYTDPDGHCPECIGGILGAGGGAAVILYETWRATRGERPIPDNKEIARTIFKGAIFGAGLGAIIGVEDSKEKPGADEPFSGPTEPYDREEHYGRTPTGADRKDVGGESVDHQPPLVRRYYEGDPNKNEPPGYQQTPEQRREGAKDRTRMQPSTLQQQRRQGAEMSRYSREKKRELFEKKDKKEEIKP